jgi:hypothetical protein
MCNKEYPNRWHANRHASKSHLRERDILAKIIAEKKKQKLQAELAAKANKGKKKSSKKATQS